jgi:hypothetical protein
VEQFDKPLRDVLELLVTGDQSLAKMLQASRKFLKRFVEAQHAHRTFFDPESLSPDLYNLKYAEQRFDSRSKPPLRIFFTMPILIAQAFRLGNTSPG